MIDKDRAVRLVEGLLRAEEREFAERGQPITLAISMVTEHRFGWIIGSQSEAYLRSGNTSGALAGGGPYLVDHHDGSIHHIPITDYVCGLWEEDYEQRIKPTGAAEADPHCGLPFATEIREALEQEGRVAAIRLLRRCAPSVSMTQANEYVAAIAAGERPSAGLIERVRPPDQFSGRLGVTTVAGPLLSPADSSEFPFGQRAPHSGGSSTEAAK
ncbi:YrhB family protein [Actinoallomurus sp. NBC_01490]|uniref:YrhB domain-containing protein n=1 Tax=Actinoallomurus sp. NBC_01490 TaxID=2903557 RepID=UPI002E312F97|nr:YrhB domain-containing protein [Actinoallomurus sp. NBC_01490]